MSNQPGFPNPQTPVPPPSGNPPVPNPGAPNPPQPAVIAQHPVQTPSAGRYRSAKAPVSVTMRAYEVYCEVFSPQEAMITDGCRSGFSTGELIAFLYAHSFPKPEWRSRVNEAFRGMEGL